MRQQRRVPHRVSPRRWRVLQGVESHSLRRHANPGVAVSDHLDVGVHPVRTGIVPTRDVEPLDEDGAIEVLGVDGPVDHDPIPVGRRRGRRDRPLAVVRERTHRRIGAGRAVEEELRLRVPHRCKVEDLAIDSWHSVRRLATEHERHPVTTRDRRRQRRRRRIRPSDHARAGGDRQRAHETPDQTSSNHDRSSFVSELIVLLWQLPPWQFVPLMAC